MTMTDEKLPHTYGDEWRRVCEARDWIKRYNYQVKKKGKRAADSWWSMTKLDIERARGKVKLAMLLDDIKKEKDATGGES